MFFPVEALRRLALPAALCCSLGASGAARLDFALDSLEAPAFSAKSIRLQLGDGVPSELFIGEVTLSGRTWRNVRVSCARLEFGRESIDCADGRADIGARIPLEFSYSTRSKRLALLLRPAEGETWRLDARFGGAERRLDLTVEGGALSNLAGWLPPDWPRVTAGRISGSVSYSDAPKNMLSAGLALRGIAFSDTSGLHAGEKIDADVKLGAEQPGTAEWRWRAAFDWKAGEVFWQPLYLRGAGHTADAEGTLDDNHIRLSRWRVTLAGVGGVEGEAEWDRRKSAIVSADARSGRLDAAALYAEVIKPFFFGTALENLRVAGSAELDVHWRESQLEALDVRVHDLSFEDQLRRFAVFGVSGRVPWHRTNETKLELKLKGGELLRVPFGAVNLPLTMRGTRFRLETVEIPLLDGTLAIREFATEPPEPGWRWAFRGGVSLVSMERFTQAVGLPTMHGTISAEIPRVSYERSTLQVAGALIFKVFDGTVEAKNVKLIEPFGKVPRLAADLDVRGIDLELLTRTFSFGKITGRVDASVAGLELANWRPVKFDARIESSPGDYPRKISQAAVQNIAALGGAGAAAALQATFLRFFEQFGYSKLGLSCKLERNVCQMDGVEPAATGYVIVKGGGIPALSVMGYNRAVDWDELVDRLKRVIQDNVSVIVE